MSSRSESVSSYASLRLPAAATSAGRGGSLDLESRMSQSARYHYDKKEEAKHMSTLPPPPLPRDKLTFPRAPLFSAASSPSLSDSLLPGGNNRRRSTHHIGRWVQHALANGSQMAQQARPAQQVEAMFWPTNYGGSSRSHNHHGSSHHHQQQQANSKLLSPLVHLADPSRSAEHGMHDDADSGATPNNLESAQQTIHALRMEIELLKRQTAPQMQLDLSYEELQNENRNLRQLKYVIHELERKMSEMKEMKAERKLAHTVEMQKATNEVVESNSKYELLLIDFKELQQNFNQEQKAHENSKTLLKSMEDRNEEYRSKQAELNNQVHSLQHSLTSAQDELNILQAQFDTCKLNLEYNKSESETHLQEVYTLQRVREMQQEMLNSVQAEKEELKALNAKLENDAQLVHTIPLISAQLVEAQNEKHLLAETLASLQTRNDTLESLLEEYQLREKQSWASANADDEDVVFESDKLDGIELLQQYRADEQKYKREADHEEAAMTAEADRKKGHQKSSSQEVEVYEEYEEEVAKFASPPTVTASSSQSATPQAPVSVIVVVSDSTGATTADPSSHSPFSSGSSTPVASTPIREKSLRRRLVAKSTGSVPSPAGPGTAPISAAHSPARTNTHSPTPMTQKHSRRPSLTPMAQTTLSRKLEKVLNASLAETSRLTAQVYQLQMQTKSMKGRDDANQARIRNLSAQLELCQSDYEKVLRASRTAKTTAKAAETALAQTREELQEERLIAEKYQADFRNLRNEYSKIQRGALHAETERKAALDKLQKELKRTQTHLENERKSALAANRKADELNTEMNGLLSQHGLAIQAKDQLMNSFTRVVAANNEMNFKLAAAESQAAKSTALEERLGTMENSMSLQSESMKRISSENDSLQSSLQQLSEAHTEQTLALQRSIAKHQQVVLENAKLATKNQNLLAQLNTEEHSTKSSSGALRAAQHELTILRERNDHLEDALNDEKRAHNTKMEHYRSARKENSAMKLKISNLKAAETKLKAQLEKELLKTKKLEVEIRTRGGMGLSSVASTAVITKLEDTITTPTTGATSDSASAPGVPHHRPSNSSGAFHVPAEIMEMARANTDSVGPESPEEKDTNVDSTSSAAASPAPYRTPRLIGAISTPDMRPSTTGSTSTPQPSQPSSLGMLADFSLQSIEASPMHQMTPEEQAAAEVERKKEEERRMKRRVPKRPKEGGGGSGDRSASPAAKGFYAEQIKAMAGAGSARRPSAAPSSKSQAHSRKPSAAIGTTSSPSLTATPAE